MLCNQKSLLLLAFIALSNYNSFSNIPSSPEPVSVPQTTSVPTPQEQEKNTSFNSKLAEESFKIIEENIKKTNQMDSHHFVLLKEGEFQWKHERTSDGKIFHLDFSFSFTTLKAKVDLGPIIGQFEFTPTKEQLDNVFNAFLQFFEKQGKKNIKEFSLEYNIHYLPNQIKKATIEGTLDQIPLSLNQTDEISEAPLKALLGLYLTALKEIAQTNPDQLKKESYEKAIKELKKYPGCFTFYKRKDDVLLEIPENDLGRLWTIIAKIHSSPFTAGLAPGDDLSLDINGIHKIPLFKWKKIDDERLFLLAPNTKYSWSKENSLSRLAKELIPEPVLAVCPIEQIEPDKKLYLVNITSLFTGDLFRIQQIFNQSGSGFSFDQSKSYLDHLVSQKDHALIRYQLHFASAGIAGQLPQPIDLGTDIRAEDNRSAPLKITFTLAYQEETNYRPRYAHREVGYFTVNPLSLDRMKRTEQAVNFIVRHHLEKLDPKASVSEVKNPIVFYLYNIPEKYEKATRKGILNWNPLFEKIGFKNAIVVKNAPEEPDWDHANGLQNVVRWSLEGNHMARAIILMNPFNGSIIGSTFNINTLGLIGESKSVEPLFSINTLTSTKQASCCTNYMKEAVSLLNLLSSSYPKNIHKDFMQQIIEHCATHESGHSLGLRHNHAAPSYYNIDQLKNPEFTNKYGTNASIMSYADSNFYAIQQKKGRIWQCTPGPYDEYAIKYGYQPLDTITPESEKPILESIVREMRSKHLDYMTDEDIMKNKINPYVDVFVLSAQPIQYTKDKNQFLKKIKNELIKKFTTNNEKLSKNTEWLYQMYRMIILNSLRLERFLGGIETSRYPRAMNLVKPVSKPVAAKIQKEALSVILETLEELQINDLPESVLFNLTQPYSSNIDKSIVEYNFPTLFQDRTTISTHFIIYLLSIEVMTRMIEIQEKMKNPADAFTLSEYFSMIHSHIFNTKPLTQARKQLHRAYTNQLMAVSTVLQKNVFFYTEPRVYAEKNLRLLKQQLEKNKLTYKTENEKDHYQDLLLKITEFLKRKTVVQDF